LTSRRNKSRRDTSTRGRSSGQVEPEVLQASARDPEVRAATREEMFPFALGATVLGFLALTLSFSKGYLLLYGDAVAHLGIARRILDSRAPGLSQLGGVWLPLPHLLMLPFVQKMEWWQNGLAGAWPSLTCYILGAAGFYKLARRLMAPRWLNANQLYLATTAMTEPLFLALIVWITLLAMECCAAIRAGQARRVTRRLTGLGLLSFAAVFTRYDGWVLAAAAWCVVTWALFRRREVLRRVVPGFALFTLLTVSGPLLWLWYNQHFFHDPLDFMRGPYSAPAIEKKTSPPGSRHYRGWHNPGWALLFYTRTAQVDASFWETGFLVLAGALAGTWLAIRRRMEAAALLLWMPLFFYVYSISYGSVPIFIPQLWPHSYYNSRYGMELLPALAIYCWIGLAALEAWMRSEAAPKWGRLGAKVLQPVMIALAVLNCLGMMYRIPSVLKEAIVNATTRVPFERNLAQVIGDFPPGLPILMRTSDYIGALQDAGIPLKQTINEGEYYSWRAALDDPAGHAAYVIAFAGDPVSQAVTEHPDGLEELTILCGTGQSCARIYRSQRWGQFHLPGAPAPAAH
jgi:hypothetical protein